MPNPDWKYISDIKQQGAMLNYLFPENSVGKTLRQKPEWCIFIRAIHRMDALRNGHDGVQIVMGCSGQAEPAMSDPGKIAGATYPVCQLPETVSNLHHRIIKTGTMAKDFTDYSTVDFIPAVLHVTRGQVLMDRQRHIAIVAKRGKNSAHLVHVRSGVLRLTRHTAGEIIDSWSEADYPFDRALAKLLELGRQHGITEAARNALEELVRAGKEPQQQNLFD
jgi:hypothetical protein